MSEPRMDAAPHRSPIRRPAVAVFVAAAAYLLFALALTFPLVRHLGTAVPHDLGDPLLSTAVLWWNATVTPLTSAWWNGPWFYPEPGTLAFSDHRLGGSLVATPLQWVGLGPLAAYNITLLLSFVFCATAAFALVHALTGRVDAAAIAGLAYGFNPYRMAHIEHLELLMVFGMPMALLAMHQFAVTRRAPWLAALSGALFLQGLCSSYYLLFFSLLLGLWIAWFMRPGEWRSLLAVGAAALAPVLVLTPIYVTFAGIHRAYNLKRAGYEIVFQSADVSSIVTASPMLALWGWTGGLNGPEKQTFPGLTIVLLAMAGAWAATRGRVVREQRDRLARASRVFGGLSVMVIGIAVAAQVWGPFHWVLGPIRLSIDVLHKPLSIALLLAVCALAASPAFRGAYERRSTLAFYGLAAAVMVLLSLGPQPKLLGQDVLYRPPYAWLMALPGFDGSIRVPARFAMLTALALSVAGGLAFARVFVSRRARTVAAAVCLLGIAADTWPAAFPLPEAPRPWPTDAAGLTADATSVLELPMGGAEYDAAAMYRAAFHGRPTVNGMSGYLTPRYKALVRAIGGHEPEALQHLAGLGPLLVAADKRDEPYQHWADYVSGAPGVTAVAEDERWRYFRLDHRPAQAAPCGTTIRRPAGASDAAGPIDLAPLVDDDARTLRSTKTLGGDAEGSADGAAELSPDELTVDFGLELPLCGIGLSLGSLAEEYPGRLQVDASPDGATWRRTFDGTTSGLALDAALARPSDARIEIPLGGGAARFVRLRLVRTRRADRWVIAELYGRVTALGAPRTGP